MERAPSARLSRPQFVLPVRRRPELHHVPRSSRSALAARPRELQRALHGMPRRGARSGAGLSASRRGRLLDLPYAQGSAPGRTGIHQPLDRCLRPGSAASAAPRLRRQPPGAVVPDICGLALITGRWAAELHSFLPEKHPLWRGRRSLNRVPLVPPGGPARGGSRTGTMGRLKRAQGSARDERAARASAAIGSVPAPAASRIASARRRRPAASARLPRAMSR